MKKVISILLCLSLVLCSAIDSKASLESRQKTYGETQTTEGGFIIENSSGMILGYVGTEKEITLPAPPKTVRLIGNETIEKIIVPYSARFTNGMQEYCSMETDLIYYNLFQGCTNLKEIVFQRENSGYCFENGMLLSQDKTTLHAVLPGYEGVVKIPATVNKIDDGAFVQALKVTAYEVESGNTIFTAKDGVLYNKDGTILKVYPLGNLSTKFTVPEGVKVIGEHAFAYSPYLQTVTMASTVERQKSFAFGECKALINVINKKGLRYIENSVYRDCTNLNLKLPDGVEVLPKTATVGVKSVIIPASAIRPSEMEDYEWGMVPNSTKLPALKVKQVKTTSSVSKGKGKTNTSWYKKNKKTFKLSTPDQLAGLAKLVNLGVNFKGKTIVLTKSMDMKKHKNWTPIGEWKVPREDASGTQVLLENFGALHTFEGKFDGNGKTIYNLKVSNQNKGGVGFFGTIGKKGVVKNLKLKGGSVLGFANVGGVAGNCFGKIDNCSFSGAVSGRQNVGGIAGSTKTEGISGTVQNCKNSAKVKGYSYVGGIVGKSAAVTNCKNTGKVSAYFEAGGIAGRLAYGAVKKCSNSGKVDGCNIVGGIVGCIGWQNTKVESKTNKNKGKVTTSVKGAASGKIYAVKKVR